MPGTHAFYAWNEGSLAVITSKVRAQQVTIPAAGRASLGRPAAALVIGLVWALTVLAATAPVLAQVTPLPNELPLKRLTPASLKAQLKTQETQAAQGEDEKIRALYDDALRDLNEETKLLAETAELEKATANAPADLAAAKAKRDAPPAPAPPMSPRLSLPELQQLLTERSAQREAARAEVKRLENEPARRQERRTQIPDEIQQARARIGEIDRQLETPAPAGETPALTQARKARLQAERQKLNQKVAKLQAELANYAATADLLPILRDIAAREASQAEENVAAVERRIEQRRLEEAREKARQARLDAARALPALQPLAQKNQSYADRNAQLPKAIESTNRALDEAAARLSSLRSEFERTKQKVERIGLTDAIGLLLRKQRASLPNVATLAQEIDQRQEENQSLRLELMELDDARLELSDLERATEAALIAIQPGGALAEEELQQAVRDILQKRKDQLDTLIRNLNTYFERRVELDTTVESLINETRRYNEYIDEHVLWIRSAPPLTLSDLAATGSAVMALCDPAEWLSVGEVLYRDFHHYPMLWIVAGITWLLMLARQRRWREFIRAEGERAAKRGVCEMAPTWRASWLTVLVTAPVPALLLFLGWRLTSQDVTDTFAIALGTSLLVSTLVLLPGEFLRQVCLHGGLADCHFEWPTATRRFLRRQLRWLVLSVPPLLMVAGLVGRLGNEAYINSLARLTFIGAVVLMTLFAHRALLPTGPVFRNLAALQYDGWVYTFRYVWYVCGVLGVLSLGVLSGLGYYYTGYQLSQRLLMTLWFLLGLLFVTNMLLRWLLLHRRRLAIEEARERRAALAASVQSNTESGLMPAVPAEAEPGPDLAKMSEQTRQLLNVLLFVVGVAGTWLIWVDVLPALGFLNKVDLWYISVDEASVPVTLGHLVLSCVILATTFLAVKNVPGLLELLLLQRLPLDAGARYAVSTIFRYLLVMVGVIWSFSMIGIDWSKYQWLVAAATVGLGFGLQEIFANFVAGLIVLFERPARVGDVITVQGVTGVVSRIRIRATTVTNWDRQEFIIPNKEFVTGNVTNWTLSNQTNRVVINVPVARGSDPEQVTKILKRIAAEHPVVLEDPAPMIVFEAFGDSTLNFSMRCYLPDVDRRLNTVHDLHCAIHREFKRAGIELAYPQRDLHIRSVDAAFPISHRNGVPPSVPHDGNGAKTHAQGESPSN